MGLYLNRLSIRHFGRIRDPNSSRGPVGAAVTKRTSDIFMLDQLDSEYGGIGPYLDAFGMAPEQIDALRGRLLEAGTGSAAGCLAS